MMMFAEHIITLSPSYGHYALHSRLNTPQFDAVAVNLVNSSFARQCCKSSMLAAASKIDNLNLTAKCTPNPPPYHSVSRDPGQIRT